jgi:hypothetical protein
MKANELRIGNFVFEPLNENKKAFKVFEIYHEEDYDKINYFNALNFQPIPLTEEWLINFGFKRVNCGIGWDEISNGKVQLTEVPTNKGKLIAFNYATDKYNYLKYVHQLQNLYFALTGVELPLTAP